MERLIGLPTRTRPAAPRQRHRAVTAAPQVDARALADALEDRLRGEVRFDAGSRALYATDASNYRQVPIGVVTPRSIEDVVAAVEIARAHGAPVLPRGGGTSLAGQSCNVAVVIDFTRHLHRVLGIDLERRTARVEPGCVLDTLRQATEAHGLTFGPDPSTHHQCALGGMLGNNACGVHSLLAEQHGFGQRTSDNTAALEVLTYDGLRLKVGPTSVEERAAIIRAGGRRGAIYRGLEDLVERFGDRIRERYPKLPRRVSGYNLDELLPENGFHVARALVGTEGTCVTILEAELHLVPKPGAQTLLVLGYPDVYAAADHVPKILEHRPVGLEGIDDRLFRYVQARGEDEAELELLPEGSGWLLVELAGADRGESDARARALMADLGRERRPPSMKLYGSRREEEMIWAVREGGLGATAWVPGEPDRWEGWEDAAVPPERVGDYLRAFRALTQRHALNPSLYGHFGQGCVHTRIGFDLYTAEGLAQYRAFAAEAAELVLAHGGSLSGEHGDGQARGELLERMFGPELVQAFREFAAIWDPEAKMNPGKVVDAAGLTEHLRLGPDYAPAEPETHFAYPEDGGSFARAALRCVGVGKCRREEGGVMCPSYMVTREEQHSTRGRAHLLFEMLRGEVIEDGWKSEAVEEALDLCLSCKGCKKDCPVSVDMATYKAEFNAHHYAGRLRPRQAYAFGFIRSWAEAASLAPAVVNLLGAAPGTGAFAKWIAGVAPQRRRPKFAPQRFRAWFEARPKTNLARPEVLLFPDTFNDLFHPGVARAAVEVLEDAGLRATIPAVKLCCGRPLYEHGFLDTAKRWLRRTLTALEPQIRAGVPMLVLEPSCAAVFRDELPNLFPDDELALRLSRSTHTLSELLEAHAPGWTPPRLARRAVVHGHCHHQSVLGFEPELRLLEKMGLELELPDSGCCGMAGAFGFEAGRKYEVSVACGERVLLPEVRSAGERTLIVTSGFSCREQIVQGTGRTPLHLAEVLRLAQRTGPEGPREGRPEASFVQAAAREHRAANLKTAALAAGLAAGGLLWWAATRRRS